MEYITKSRTYKLKASNLDASIYFTIVYGDSSIDAMFVNSKEMSSFQWVTALMTAYTKLMKAGCPVEQIIKDMEETFDPNGSYLVFGKKDDDGNQVTANSIIHHLGMILKEHVNENN